MAAVIKAVTAEKVASLKTYKASELSTGDLLALTARPRIDFTSILDTVRLAACQECHCHGSAFLWSMPQRPLYYVLQVTPIVEDVRKRGDAAVKEFTARFDGVDLSSVCVPIEVCFPCTSAHLADLGSDLTAQ